MTKVYIPILHSSGLCVSLFHGRSLLRLNKEPVVPMTIPLGEYKRLTANVCSIPLATVSVCAFGVISIFSVIPFFCL